MSSRPIATTWDDPEPWLLNATRPAFAPVVVANKKPVVTGAYSQILIRADLQQRVTPISRYVRIGVQAWVATTANEADFPAARALARDYGAHLEMILNDAATSGPFLAAEVDSGPLRVTDSTSGLEYAYVTILAEVHAA